MTVLFQINVVANSGSTGRIAEGIAEMAIREGWDCYTAYGRWANKSKTNLYKIGSKLDVYVHYFISRLLDMHGLASRYATKGLISEIEKINPTIIHLHNIHGYYINYQILFEFLSRINIPVVWTLHDCWSYTGHCVHYIAKGCRKWISGCYNCPNLQDYPVSSFFDNSKNNYQLKKLAFTSVKRLTIVTVSEWLAGEVKKSYLREYDVKVIHNGIDIDVFYPTVSKFKVAGRFLILGVATQWSKRKGLDDFLALSRLLSSDETILLVGLSQSQISNLPSNMIGKTNTENVSELVEYYSSADLFINFSVEETFGLTTAESMACGTPVLVYNSTACPEIVTNETGFVIEPHDINEAIKVIKHIKHVGKRKYSNNCRTCIEKKYKKEDKYNEYMMLYKELL